MTPTTKRAVEKYGREICEQAYHMNVVRGEGANTIGFLLHLTTRQADAAINAGAELAGKISRPADYFF